VTAEPFVAHVSRLKVAGVLICGSIFIVAGIWLLLNADASHRSPPVIAYVAGAAMLVYTASAMLAIGSLLDLGRPLIEIGSDGLIWRHWSGQRVPWRAIKRAHLRRAATQSILFTLHQPRLYPPRGLRRPAVAISRLFGGDGIVFSNQASDQSFEAMLEAVRRFAPDLQIEGYSLPNTAS
jgi:hypothetical protein